MAFNLKFDTSAYKGGPVVETVVPNFPTNVREAIAAFGEDEVMRGFVKSYVIAAQAKIRAEYKAPASGTRTKRGSAIAQIEAANREAQMKAASQAVEESAK